MKSNFSQSLVGRTTLALSFVFGAVCAEPDSPLHHHDHHGHDHSEHILTDGPISVMGSHIHEAGESMVAYRYMFMDMDGMEHGTSSVSPTQVFNSPDLYTVTPTRMTMDMHMLGLMYAPSDRVTLMAMLPYVTLEMDHRIFPGAAPLIALNGGSETFTTRSSGVGDLKLSSLIRLFDDGPHHLHGALGVSLPTASVAERDIVPGPGGRIMRQLPASMQVGSGTFDVLPSLTYGYQSDQWGGGIQLHGIYRTHTNHHNFRLGNRVGVDTWLNYQTTDWLTLTTGLSYLWEDTLSGRQSDVSQNPPFAPARRTVPTAFGQNYGGHLIEGLLGVNVFISAGSSVDHRIGADIRIPLWEDVNGYRLGIDYTATLGWQILF